MDLYYFPVCPLFIISMRTGKSVIAFNLAAIAAREGYKSLIVDCDWYFGNIHILANAIPELTLADIIHNENLTPKAVIHLNERLHMIASSASGRSETEYSTAILTRFLQGIRTSFRRGWDFMESKQKEPTQCWS